MPTFNVQVGGGGSGMLLRSYQRIVNGSSSGSPTITNTAGNSGSGYGGGGGGAYNTYGSTSSNASPGANGVVIIRIS